MNKLISTKNCVFKSLVGQSETGKSQLIYHWLKIGIFQTETDKTYFFYQHYEPLLGFMQKETERCKFWMNRFVKKQRTKHLLIFDDSCEEICNSKVFVDIATAGRHRVLSSIYIRHNLFHESKLGRDVELQNTHIVLFNSHSDMMQVSTLSAQLGLESDLVGWFRDATSVLYGHLSID